MPRHVQKILDEIVDFPIDKDYHYQCKEDILVVNILSEPFPPVQVRNSLITFLIFRKDLFFSPERKANLLTRFAFFSAQNWVYLYKRSVYNGLSY